MIKVSRHYQYIDGFAIIDDNHHYHIIACTKPDELKKKLSLENIWVNEDKNK